MNGYWVIAIYNVSLMALITFAVWWTHSPWPMLALLLVGGKVKSTTTSPADRAEQSPIGKE